MIRQYIMAPEGYMIVGGDASQIEARFNAWFSGEKWLVDAFAAGEDIYSKFASVAFARPINRRDNPEDEIPGFIGKTCILGMGFGVGWLKLGQEFLSGRAGPSVSFDRSYLDKLSIDPGPFLSDAKNVELIRALPSRLPLVDRLIHFTVAHYFVKVYRGQNKAIVKNWRYMEHIIKRMLNKEYGRTGPNGILEIVEDGVRLPSGLVVHYLDLRAEEGGNYTYYSKRGGRVQLYGAKLMENLTQALCRIIVADAMVRLKKDGLRIVSMEHDAIIGLSIEEYAAAWLARILHEISSRPVWAPDLPLAAEGGFGKTLAKAK